MKKNLLFYLLCCSELLFATTKPTAARVLEFVQSGKSLTPVSLFDESPIRNEDALKIVPEGQFLRLNQSILAEAIAQHPEGISVALPFRGERIVVDLIQAQVHTADFSVINQEYKGQTYQQGLHFRGMIHGNPNSMAAFSFYDNEVMGLMADDVHGNIVLGRLATNGNLQEYVLYEDKKMTVKMPFSCATKDESVDNEQIVTPSSGNRSAVNGCVRIYFEGDYVLYQYYGSVQATVNYLSGLFNEMATLYANENVSVQFSQCMVWTTPDPYSISSSANALSSFQAKRGNNYNGDMGHLLALGAYNLGGLANFDVLCTSTNRLSYSNIDAYYDIVPVYSWTIFMVTHETGHNLGSRHTHWCGWSGGAIDNCAFSAGIGYEPYNSVICSNAPTPTNGGTIMSYCHLTSNLINFANGFGVQPGNKIRSRVVASSCLSATCSASTCAPPDSIDISNIGTDSALIAWRNSAGANAYKLLYRLQGASTWITINNVSNPYTLKSLRIGKTYEVLLQANCSNISSVLSSGVIFKTILDCTIPASTWAGENFEDTPVSSTLREIPPCWTRSGGTNQNNTYVSYADPNSSNINSNKHLSISPIAPIVASPALTNVGTGTKRLSFKKYFSRLFTAGYMTNNADPLSFVPIKSFGYTYGDYTYNGYTNGYNYNNIQTKHHVYLGLIPSNPAYLAFRNDNSYYQHIDDVEWFDVTSKDIGITSLVSPVAEDCFSNNQSVVVRVQNEGLTTLDFSLNPLTVKVVVTGAATTTLTKVINTGLLTVATSMDVTLNNSLNMTTAGMYIFDCQATIIGDGFISNDTLPKRVRVVYPTVSYPHFNDFTDYPIANYNPAASIPYLSSASNNWIELRTFLGNSFYGIGGVGVFEDFGHQGYGKSAVLSSGYYNYHLYNPYNYYYSDYKDVEHLRSPKIPLGANPVLEFSTALTKPNSIAPFVGNIQNDSIIVSISTDCAKTWTILYAFEASNFQNLSNSFKQFSLDLSAYANQTVIIDFSKNYTQTQHANSYYFHIDNIAIQDACNGTPTLGNIVGPMNVCVDRTFYLKLSTQGANLSYQWQYSDGTQPFADIIGANQANCSLLSQTTATSYRCIVTCNNSGQSTVTPAFLVGITNPLYCYCMPSSTFSSPCASNLKFNKIQINTTATGIPWTFYPTCGGIPNYNNYITPGVPRTTLKRNKAINFDFELNNKNWVHSIIYKVKVWIDGNDDGIFLDANEFVASIPLVSATGFNSATMFISNYIPRGIHQIRFKVFSYLNLPSCDDDPSLVQTNDFTIEVIDGCDAKLSTNLNLGTNSLPITCQESNFTYYGKDSTFHFAIDWNGNTSARDSALVSVGLLPSTPIFAGTYGASKAMKRFWNVNLKGQVLTNPVKVRFYYSNTEFADIQSFSSNKKWFTVNSGIFNPLNVNNYNAFNGALNPANTTNQTANVTYGTTSNGVAYAEMANLTNLTGGTLASDTLALAVRAKVFLNNLIISNQLMYNDLAATSPNFPLSDPYKIAPLNSNFIHVNNPTIASTTTTVVNAAQGNAIVDWVFVELRTGVSGSTTVVATKAGLLQRDGDIVNMDGVSPLHFNVAAGYYFVAIRHHNNIGFRTAAKVFLNANSPLLNFTNNSVAVYGVSPLVRVPNTTFFVMNAGDANHDGSLDSVDSAIWEAQNGNFDDYFLNADYNLDSSIDGIDSAIWETNNGKYEELD